MKNIINLFLYFFVFYKFYSNINFFFFIVILLYYFKNLIIIFIIFFYIYKFYNIKFVNINNLNIFFFLFIIFNKIILLNFYIFFIIFNIIFKNNFYKFHNYYKIFFFTSFIIAIIKIYFNFFNLKLIFNFIFFVFYFYLIYYVKLNYNINNLLKNNFIIFHIPFILSSYIFYLFSSILNYSLIKNKFFFKKNKIRLKYLIYKLNLISLINFSIGCVLGSFWAKISWGSYWNNDVKEYFSLIFWIYNLIIIHYIKYFNYNNIVKLFIFNNLFLIYFLLIGLNFFYISFHFY